MYVVFDGKIATEVMVIEGMSVIFDKKEVMDVMVLKTCQ
jgi:hypothetical protein